MFFFQNATVPGFRVTKNTENIVITVFFFNEREQCALSRACIMFLLYFGSHFLSFIILYNEITEIKSSVFTNYA